MAAMSENLDVGGNQRVRSQKEEFLYDRSIIVPSNHVSSERFEGSETYMSTP